MPLGLQQSIQSVEQLRELTSPLAAVFPEPFDDFRQDQPKNVWSEAAIEIDEQLAQASSLADAPGLAAMAFASVPSEHAVVNVLRIVSTTAEEPFTNAKTELPYLQTGAHFALAARSEAIAQAIAQRCFC